MSDKHQKIVIIGAGPAGLTAAYELAQLGFRNIKILESTDQVGGLSRTVNHKGNRIDIGGHRFFSKSDWVMQWWLDKLPLADKSDPHTLQPQGGLASLAYQGQRRDLKIDPIAGAANAEMLVRNRLSRILFSGKLFDYPLKLNFDTAWKLGPLRCLLFGLSYLRAHLFPIKNERTLEEFFINRFGRRLYRLFFKEYTEKVWGKPCSEISADWGAQRVKSLSIGTALLHALKNIFAPQRSQVEQTSLIEHFLYPRLGPGQMWETVAERLKSVGIELRLQSNANRISVGNGKVTGVEVGNPVTGQSEFLKADVIISTMPIRDLVGAMGTTVPERVRDIAGALEYRDFMTVGLLYKKMQPRKSGAEQNSIPDNWIYIQEPGVKVGRLQIFNNWSPYLVKDPEKVWVGLEFFCDEQEEFWKHPDQDLITLAKKEMADINLALAEDCEDGVVIRMPKAYPGYYGSYNFFSEVREYLDAIPNLFLIGRNGMHRYNNQDHSMLSAKFAVEAIVSGNTDKAAIWSVNIDDDYHEEAALKETPVSTAAVAPISVPS